MLSSAIRMDTLIDLSFGKFAGRLYFKKLGSVIELLVVVEMVGCELRLLRVEIVSTVTR